MTYSMLLEFVMNIFNLDPNVRFNLSFNLTANERDITNDDDVDFFIDCATNSITDEIPHLYIRPPKVEARIIPGPVGILQKALARKKADVQAGGYHNILTTQEYVRKVNEDVSEDDHFMQGPWLQAIVYLHGEGLSVSGCLGDMKQNYIKGKLELVVGVVKSCTTYSLGDMTVTLKYPTGTMGDTIHYKVFQDEKKWVHKVYQSHICFDTL
ncbi:reverse transcriptase domain-containing protein [Tanacetum coccineum]